VASNSPCLKCHITS